MLSIAQSNRRLTGGAITGSAATHTEDGWSDVDVAFGVSPDVKLDAVLADWTALVERELGLLHYFDLRAGPAIYRVFLLPNGLELDIGLWPAAQFGPTGEKFNLIFGKSGDNVARPSVSQDHLIGLCWHHALHADTSIERAKFWEAEYYISALRDHTLELACLRLKLPAAYARGLDKLPDSIKAQNVRSLVRSLEIGELRRALKCATNAFLDEAALDKPELAESLRRVVEQRHASKQKTPEAT